MVQTVDSTHAVNCSRSTTWTKKYEYNTYGGENSKNKMGIGG